MSPRVLSNIAFVHVPFSTAYIELIKPQCKLKNKYISVTRSHAALLLESLFGNYACTALEKAPTGQTRRHTNHVTYQQAFQDHHCQAQHLLRFLLTPPYPIQAGDERKTSLDVGTKAGHCRENNHFLELWVRCARLSGYSMVSAPMQCTLASMLTVDAGFCKCTLYKMA